MMPYQDHLYLGYVPKTWADLREVLASLGKNSPEEVSFNTIDPYTVEPLGTIEVDGFGTLPVIIFYASWDGGGVSDLGASVCQISDETGKLWLGVGVQLTERYRPAVLDRTYPDTGRPDFFEFNLLDCLKIKGPLDAFIGRETTMVLSVQFY